MKVIIMAGGSGTRLQPLTFAIPKPLLPIKEKPILEIILAKLKSHGFIDIILAVGYKSELIKTYFQDGQKFGVNISYYNEDKKLGTAGPLKQIKKIFNISEPVLVMNGDILTKLDFNKFIDFHKNNKADFTIGIKENIFKTRFGVIKVEEKENCKIQDIEEKPEIKMDINTGMYVANPEILDLVPVDSYFDMPDLIKKALKENKNIFGYRINDFWMAIEKIEHVNEVNEKEDLWKERCDI